ncbi:hypothetical protein GRJ2_000939700 [Grus japonensis]|uniref:Uncharacterized protein n=1 Tax=Grus japonensis TaxID=30415 RepID=A0ABC9WGZ4_GRUJA
MPASSKTDPLLAKAEPISNGGSASGITELRREKKNLGATFLQPERGVRRCERNNSADTKVSAEGGGGRAPGTGAEIPLQPVEKTMVRQAVPLQPMKDDGRADIHLQPVEDPTLEQVDAQRRLWPHGKPTLEQAPDRTCGLVERGAHAGAGLLAGLVTSWGTPRWSSLLLKIRTLWNGPTLEQFMKNCNPWEGLTLEKLVEDCLMLERPHAGAGEECEESSP